MITGSLNYASLDEFEIVPMIQTKKQVVPKTEQSECNVVVMIFIGSVLFLALMDSIK